MMPTVPRDPDPLHAQPVLPPGAADDLADRVGQADDVLHAPDHLPDALLVEEQAVEHHRGEAGGCGLLHIGGVRLEDFRRVDLQQARDRAQQPVPLRGRRRVENCAGVVRRPGARLNVCRSHGWSTVTARLT